MPYLYYILTEGSSSVTRSSQQIGFKLKPFVPGQIANTNYSRSIHQRTGGNDGQAVSGSVVGEVNALFNASAKLVVQSGNLTIPLGPASEAYARAYSNFKDKVYAQAANLTALVERGKTFDMVLSRLNQLHKGAKALRKGQFRKFLGTFGIKAKPKDENRFWSRPKDFAGLWLEYWMGWAPTLGDIYTSLEFLGSEIPSPTVRAGSAAPLGDISHRSVSGSYRYKTMSSGKCRCWIQADVKLTNPSLYNLNGLGLLNPLKTLWETTPFSWFADWFTNVGQVLGRLTDWVGLSLENLIVSCKTDGDVSWERIIKTSGVVITTRRRKVCYFVRKVGGVLPIVKPILRIPNGLSLTRGLTLSSLLIQLFAPEKAR